MSLRDFPTLNLATVVAATFTVLSVPGTLASLAALEAVEKVPNPINATESFLTNASVKVSNTASTAALESFFDKPLFSATASINWVQTYKWVFFPMRFKNSLN